MRERAAGACSLSIRFVLAAAFICGAAALSAPGVAQAASCCGGGSASALTLPKGAYSMYDVSLDVERYNGYWNSSKQHIVDPPGSSMAQYRLNLGYAYRLSDNWQAGVGVPYVWNDTKYAAASSASNGVGDMAVSVWYEAFDSIMCVYKVDSIEDLRPAVYIGGGLTLPTGVSPFDGAPSSFDITGRGFYRLDASLLAEKTVWPWTAAITLSYGAYLERPVNREYGEYVKPYHKKPGDRRVMSISGGYTKDLADMDTLTFTLAYSDMAEYAGTIDGSPDPTSGLAKKAFAFTGAWASPAKDWVVRLSWSKPVTADGWGANFPATEVLSMGLSYVYR